MHAGLGSDSTPSLVTAISGRPFIPGVWLALCMDRTQLDQVEISSKGTQGLEGHVYHAKDDVIVAYRDIKIEADEVIWDKDSNIVTAGNHVRFTRGEEHIEADHIAVNLGTKAGDFTNVTGE